MDKTTGKPLVGVDVELSTEPVHGQGGTRTVKHLLTDGAGVCVIPTAGLAQQDPMIVVRKEGYAVRQLIPHWSAKTGFAPIPGAYTLSLEPATTIGGVVQDRQGRPIPGARVVIMARSPDGEPEFSYVDNATATTDAQGRWRFAGMPSDWEWTHLRISHPDYVESELQKDFPVPPKQELKARAAVSVLDEGFRLQGRVLDEQGRPIAGAHVALGSDRRVIQRYYPSTTADAAGRYQFGHVPAGAQTVTAQAPGRAPDVKTLTVGPDTPPLEFRLGRGETLRGRVVDRQGEPLAGVAVELVDWRNMRSLDWKTRTDAEGRFGWASAPADPVSVHLTKPGYVMIAQHKLQAGETEHQITMITPLRVRGTVADANTGRPIGKFTAVEGYCDSSDPKPQVHWQRGGGSHTFTGGRYEVASSPPHVATVAVRIEAEGYQPVESPHKIGQGEVTFDARLVPGIGPSGIVHGPDGRPLAGATVVLSTRSQRAQLYNGRFHERAYPQVVTGSDGRFTLPAQDEPYRIAVVHDSGYAEVRDEELERSPDIILDPWGRVEGVVRTGSKPAAGERVRLTAETLPWAPDEAPPIGQGQELKTDAQGRFAMDRVIPGEVEISRIFTLARSVFHVGSSPGIHALVEPGQTIRVELGGTGRPVVGRLILPEGTNPKADWPYYGQVLDAIAPEAPRPKGLTSEQQAVWYNSWLRTEAGRAYLRARRVYDLNLQTDGSFRVEDVPAGSYRLRAEAHEPHPGVPGRYGPKVAAVSTIIVVPEVPSGRSDEPLELGSIGLKTVVPPPSP